MKTLQQIKEEVARDYGWESWTSCCAYDFVTITMIDEVSKRYAKETAMQALKNAAANSTLEDEDGRERGESVYDYYDNRVSISKESILNKNNIPEM